MRRGLVMLACSCRFDLPPPSNALDDAGTDGLGIDSSPPCVTASRLGSEQRFSVGGTGTALAVALLDGKPGRDVAIAVGSGVQIMSGNGAGSFSLGTKIVTTVVAQVDDLVIDDFDADGDNDLVVWDEGGSSIAAIRQDSTVV